MTKDIYILDTNVIRFLFTMYYKESSAEIFNGLENLIKNNRIISVKEVLEELKDQNMDEYKEFITNNKKIFEVPSENEIETVRRIYSKPIYRNSVKEKVILEGRHFADPFLIAKAESKKGILVTTEKADSSPSKIPNICKLFNVKCISFREFIRILRIIGDEE